jgi:hypothetical protein
MASTERCVEAIFHVEVSNMNEFKAVTQLILIGHGRTILNAAGRFRGREDVVDNWSGQRASSAAEVS